MTKFEDILVHRSALGEIIAYDRRDKFLAHFIPEKGWAEGDPFPAYTLEEYFYVIQDEEEAIRILTEARNVLRQQLPGDSTN